MAGKELTGRKVLAITVSAFAVIIGVNLVMAFKAVSTFPGLEVRNGYVASQTFNERLQAQKALGWVVETGYADGRLTLTFRDRDGDRVVPRDLSILIGRTTESNDDIRPELTGQAGRYAARVGLDEGKWMLLVQAKAEDGTDFRQRLDLFVRG